MQFKISKELLVQIEQLIHQKNDQELSILLNDLHHADIAEIFDELESEEAIYIFKLLDSEITAEILLELEDDVREKILQGLSAKEIAEEIDELDTDDAADIIGELPQKKKEQVISELEDVEHAKDIVDLLRYDEDSAGGLMGKELVKVNENWNVLTCVKEMRIQAENVTRVHSIYVVDDENRLKGRLSLKDLLVTSTKTMISDVYIKKVDSVRVNDSNVEVAGHTDKRDTSKADYNQNLSEKRAKSVSDYLIKHGIDAKRLTAKGYGFDNPIAENDPKEGNKANRRVELIRQK